MPVRMTQANIGYVLVGQYELKEELHFRHLWNFITTL